MITPQDIIGVARSSQTLADEVYVQARLDLLTVPKNEGPYPNIMGMGSIMLVTLEVRQRLDLVFQCSEGLQTAQSLPCLFTSGIKVGITLFRYFEHTGLVFEYLGASIVEGLVDTVAPGCSNLQRPSHTLSPGTSSKEKD